LSRRLLAMSLRKYVLPSVKGEGWAIVVIDTSSGFFATVSDWGSYAYLWSDPGCEFRKFLVDLNADYLHGKLMMGRPDRRVYNGKETLAEITKYLKEAIEDETTTHPRKKRLQRELSDLHDFDLDYSDEEFRRWCEKTSIEEPWTWVCYSPNPECWGFCTNVWPRFVEMLRNELTLENEQLGTSAP
jgi:hypothetical protein